MARLADLNRISEEKQIARFTAFCDERQAMIAQEYARQSGAKLLLFGGYQGAVRRIAGFFPSWQPFSEEAFPISAVTLGLPREASLTHRDYLGSLMALQITRESIGDILPGEGICTLFLLESVAPVVLDELRRVGSAGVRPVAGAEGFIPPEPAYRELRGTVASLRMDCLVHLLTGLAREKSAALLRAERVRRNHQTVTEAAARFEQGDVISIRGYGRFKVDSIGAPTKKGRLPVVCLQFI